MWDYVGGLSTSLHRPSGLLLLLGCCEVDGSCDGLFLVLFPVWFLHTQPGSSLAFGLSSCTTHNFHSYDRRLGNISELNRALHTVFTLKLASLPIKFAN